MKNDVNALAANALDFIKSVLVQPLSEFGKECIEDAQDRSGYQSFTGQTFKGISAAVIDTGGNYRIKYAKGKSPVRRKVEKGEHVFLENPYEGEPRAVKGVVTIIGDDIRDETIAGAATGEFPELVVLSNTEYSRYLEEGGLNVLTDTRDYALQNAVAFLQKKVDKIK